MDSINLKDKFEVVLRSDSQDGGGVEISLRAIIEALLRRKKLIVSILIVTVLLAFVATRVTDPNRGYQGVASIMISFNFEGIEKGLDPHGKRFDLGVMRAPVVLSDVVEILGLDHHGITTDHIRNNLEIKPVVPGDIVEKIKYAIENVSLEEAMVARMDDFTYYPTRFVLSFKVHESLGISNELGRQVLEEIVDSYTRYFYDTYSDRTVLASAIETINYEEYDYPEVSHIMLNQVNIIQSYLGAKKREAPEFRSQVTGLSFGDIQEAVALVENLDISRMSSLISAYRVSKDPDKLIKSLEFRIKNYELRMAQKQDESRQAAEVMEKFEKERSLVFMGGVGTPEGIMETEKTSPLYDELALRALDTGVSASTILHEIEFLRREIEVFSAEDNVPVDLKRQAEVEVAHMIESIDGKLKNWINLTVQTVNDYYENIYFERAIMRMTPAQVQRPSLDKLQLNMAIALILGLILGVFVALFVDYWQAGGEQEKKEKTAQDRGKESPAGQQGQEVAT